MQSTVLELDVRPLTSLFKALGDETRLRIVALLTHGELCVCHLQDALDAAQPNISRQLAVLRAAGVVEARRKGSWVYYRLAAQEGRGRARQLRALAGAFVEAKELKRDVERLLAARGPDSCR